MIAAADRPDPRQRQPAQLPYQHHRHLPRPLAWAVGNANFHHVHHLSAKIPNYRLRAAHTEQPLFAATPVITPRGSLAALRLKLWDEERGCLVRFPARRAREDQPSRFSIPIGREA